MLDANGAIACAECGRQARAVRDRLKAENDGYAGQLTRLTYEAELLRRENAKLRELVRDYEHCTMYADCAHCKYDGKLSTHCPLSPCFPDTDELRELGVEVDE